MTSSYAGIVLCGGRSSRMGYPKALLPFGPELMLQRVVRIVSDVVRPIVVVAAPAEDLPPLPEGTLAVHDRREGRGPLEGIAAGLAALPVETSAAYVTSCDVPLLRPAFVRRMIELHAGNEIAVPHCGGFFHPLAAVYAKTVLPQAERLLATDRSRVGLLFETINTRVVAEHELRDVDPDLASLQNLNEPADYQAALAEAGYELDREIARLLGVKR
jgi:molybdopterin-guanine dinucleotide biosynthesis protein A